MAVAGLQTLNGVNIHNVDADPSLSPGLEAPVGSIALFNGSIYSRFSSNNDTDWRIQTTNTVFLDPANGAVAAGNTYVDWPSVHAAAAAINGPAFIRILGSSALDIPSGTYDMTNIVIEGPITSGTANINIRDGASFTNLTRLGENVFFRNFDATTPPILQTTNGTLSLRVGRGTSLRNNVGGSALIRVTAGTLRITFDSGQMVFGSQPVIDLTTSNVSTLTLNGTTDIDDDQLSGTSQLAIVINDHGVSYDTDQPNYSGPITVTDNTETTITALIPLSPTTAGLPAGVGGMTLALRNNHPILEAPAGATTTEAYWSGAIPGTYAGGNIRIRVYATKGGATAGTARLRTAIEILSAGDDIATDSFLIDAGMTITPGGDGLLISTTVTIGAATLGNPAVYDPFRLRLQRIPTDAADTLAETLQITHVLIEEV